MNLFCLPCLTLNQLTMSDLLVRSVKEIKLHHCYNTPLHALPRTFNICDTILMISLCVCAWACFVDVNPSMVIITRMTNTGSHLLKLFPWCFWVWLADCDPSWQVIMSYIYSRAVIDSILNLDRLWAFSLFIWIFLDLFF